MAIVAIAGGVLLVHIEPQALHGVHIRDVSEAEGVSELRGEREVGAVVPALGPVHHQGVGAHIGPAPALRAPVGRGRARDSEKNTLLFLAPTRSSGSHSVSLSVRPFHL